MGARSKQERADGGLSFEESLAKLENIVRTLEIGDVRLEEALRLFEEGSALAKRCLDELDSIERRLEEIKVVDGRVRRVPLEERPRAGPGEEE